MQEVDKQLVEDDQNQIQDQYNDEEKCLIQKEEVPPVVLKGRGSSVKKLRFTNYFAAKIQQMKRPEVLLVIVALLLTMAWFEIICIVKHDHDQMKLKLIQKSQKELSSTSFIDVSHSQKTLQDGNESSQLNAQKRALKGKHHKSTKKEKEKEIDWDNLKMVTPLLDEKEYKFMKLDNGIKVLLISDKETPQSYAAMDVRIGSWYEPIPGLAHFLEHMKFIATNEFTQTPNAFDNFLSDNQGSSNAYTDSDHTNYHYQISPVAFEESLKYFSYMFNKSQFKREYVMKEINAVNSEFVNTLQNDNWKIQYVIELLSKKDHPQSRFTCGSNETLISDKFDILKELDDFDKNNYSSNMMSLVVYSNQPMDELKTMVQNSDFDKIPNLNKEQKNFDKISIDDNSFGKIYKIKLIKQQFKSLYIYTQIENERFQERHDFTGYFENVLASSEQGAFYQKMKEQNYVSTVQFGRFQRTNQHTSIMLQVDLTDDGYQNIDEVLRSYYIFIEDFKQNVDKDNYNQKKNFEDILFKYDSNDGIDEDRVSDFATYLSYVEKPEEMFLQGKYREFKKKQFINFLEQIGNPKKHLIFITGSNFDENQKLNSELIESIDNTFTKEDKFLNVSYDEILALTDDHISYLTSYEKNDEAEKNLFSFIYTLDLDLAPKGDISFYDAKKDDSTIIAKKVNLDSLDLTGYPSFLTSTTGKKLILKSNNVFANIISKKQEEYTEDPFLRVESNSLQKFAFTQERWEGILSETNSDNQYHPILLVDKDHIKSFIMIDFDQKEPQTLCKFKLTNKNRGFIPKKEQIFNQVFMSTQMRHLEDQFAKVFESKYGFSIATSNQDVNMAVSGWDNNFQSVMKDFIVNLQEYQPTEDEWNAAVDNQILSVQSEISDYPLFRLLMRQVLPKFVDNQFYDYNEQIELLQKSKISDIKKYKDNLFTATHLDVLFSGNISPSQSIEYTKDIKSLFQMTEVTDEIDLKTKIVNLSQKSYVYQQKNPNPEDLNSVTINLYQVGERNLKSIVYLSLLSDKMDRFFFEYLRTKKALGYVAGAKLVTYGCVDNMVILLQGGKKQPNEINKIIEKGLNLFGKNLEKIEEDEFKESLKSLKISYEMLPPSLSDKFTYMWTQIDREKYDFDIRYYFLSTLENEITLDGLKDFYKTHFRENASKLSLQVYSQAQPFDANDLNAHNYAKNLKETILINNKDDIVKLNKEEPYYKCSYTL